QLDPIKENFLQIIDEQKSFSGPKYDSMLFSSMKFLLDYQIYYEWLSNGVLSSEIKNHTIIIIKSIEYSPPLLIDPFVQYNQWIKKYYNLEKIHFDNQYVSFSYSIVNLTYLSKSNV
ncbi:unnamed protein product, partial [Adineta steineri]